MNSLTAASQNYISTFSGYTNTFLHWGQCLFFSLLVINIVWMSLWYAFDNQSFSESMPSFLKKFSGIAIFFTIMIHPGWLGSVLDTVTVMGSEFTHQKTDPSSIIEIGLGLANKIMVPFHNSSLLTAGFGMIVILIAYVIVIGAFISIAIELAVTLIVTTALISISTFFLGFAGLNATTQIARQTLDVILANCIKILGIYIVVAAGSDTFSTIATQLPAKFESFDPYVGVVAGALLFGVLAKTLPNQLAKIVSGAIQESHGEGGATAAMSTIQIAQTVASMLNVAGTAALGAAKIAGSTAFNAAAHFNSARTGPGGVMQGVGAAIGGSAADLAKSAGGNLSDRFKNLGSKLAGGPGSQQSNKSVSQRMYERAKDLTPRS